MSDDDGATDWTDYESGPFCRHWADPRECDEPCACGHACSMHWREACDACDCVEWREADAAASEEG